MKSVPCFVSRLHLAHKLPAPAGVHMPIEIIRQRMRRDYPLNLLVSAIGRAGLHAYRFAASGGAVSGKLENSKLEELDRG